MSLLFSDHANALSSASVQLPVRYLGVWGNKHDANSYHCVTQDEKGTLVITGGLGKGTYQRGFAFKVEEKFYAYVIATQINLATGNLVRFDSHEGELSRESLDLDSIVKHLKKAGLPVRGEKQVTVEFSHVLEALKSETVLKQWSPNRVTRIGDSGFDCAKQR